MAERGGARRRGPRAGRKMIQCSDCERIGVEARGLCRRCYDRRRGTTRTGFLPSGAKARNGRLVNQGATKPILFSELPDWELAAAESLISFPDPETGAPPAWIPAPLPIVEVAELEDHWTGRLDHVRRGVSWGRVVPAEEFRAILSEGGNE